MKLTIPLGGFNRSGGVKTLVVLANAFAEDGWRVRVVVPDYAATPTFELSPRIEVQPLVTFGGARAVRVVVYYLRLAVVAARDADVCVANFYATAYCAWLSRLWYRSARLIYFLQGDEAESHGRLAAGPVLSRWVRYAVARGSYRLPISMVCVSQWLRDHVNRPDATVVGQGIDREVFHPAAAEVARHSLVVGTIGNSARVKGYRDVIGAVSMLPPRSFELAVASSEAVELPANVPARSIRTASEMQMAAFYRSCDVFVFASHREGFGLPPLEAMACGCAVVTTDCGGVRDFARDGENCVMVPVGDREALATAIRRLLDDDALRARVAAEGARTALEWPRARMIERFRSHLGIGLAPMGSA